MTTVTWSRGPDAEDLPDLLLEDHVAALRGTDPVRRFMASVLERVRISCDAGSGLFTPYDDRGRMTSPMVIQLAHGASAAETDALLRAYVASGIPDQTPLSIAPAQYGEAKIIGDRELCFAPDGRRTPYGEFVFTHGVVSHLALLLRRGQTIVGNVLLCRMAGQQPFGDRDRQTLLGLHELVESGFVLGHARITVADRLDSVYGRALTTREAEVAGLVAEGASNQEVADRLFLTVATVKTHLYNAFEKLGVNSRTELAALYRRELPGSDQDTMLA